MRTTELASALVIGFMLIAAAGCESDGTIPPAADHYCKYMPTDVGNRWEYKVTVESMFSPREEYKLTYEIKSTKSPYAEGFPTGYIVTVTQEGGSPEQIALAPYENKCYLERAMMAYLIEDEMEKGVWNQTGLVNDRPLEYRRDVQITVPAGTFGKNEGCRELFFDNGDEFKPEKWRELYAEGVGLVYYENDFKQYRLEPFELTDWRQVKYELTDYVVKKHETPAF